MLLIVCFSLNNIVNKCKWIGLARIGIEKLSFLLLWVSFILLDNDSWLLGILLRAFNIILESFF